MTHYDDFNLNNENERVNESTQHNDNAENAKVSPLDNTIETNNTTDSKSDRDIETFVNNILDGKDETNATASGVSSTPKVENNQTTNSYTVNSNSTPNNTNTGFTNPYAQGYTSPYSSKPYNNSAQVGMPFTEQRVTQNNTQYAQNQSNTQGTNSGYYHHSFVNNNTQNQTPQNGTNTANSNANTQQKKKDSNKAKMPKGAIAAVIAVCVLLSGAFGFGGTMLANYISSQNMNADGTMVVHQIEANEVSADKSLVDKTTTQITEDVADSVVEITTELMTTNSFYGQQIAKGAGSGVIISEDGYIITNDHVIENATKINVTLRNGESYEAKLIGKDDEVDVALLKIEAKGLKVAVFGDSSKLSVGDKAVAIGNPLGQLGGTVTDGIISALDRTVVIDDQAMNLLQTNAAINPGNSGGGLFNGQGELVGLVVAKSSGETVEGLGFAIPINDILDILPDLKEHGYVTGRPELGVTFVDLTNSMYSMYYFGNANQGCYVYSMKSGSNAEKAGLKVGDRVISVNKTEIKSSSDIEDIIKKLSVGDEVTLEVERSGQTGTIKVELQEKVPDLADDSKTTQQNNAFNPFG